MILPTERPLPSHPNAFRQAPLLPPPAAKKRHHCVSFCDDITVVEFECDKCPLSVSRPLCVSRNLKNTLFLPRQVSKFFDRYVPYETEQKNILTLIKEMSNVKTSYPRKPPAAPSLNQQGNLKLTLFPENAPNEFLSMTSKERQWLATVQIHQLHEIGSTDYYFKQYMAKTYPGTPVLDPVDYLKQIKTKKQAECDTVNTCLTETNPDTVNTCPTDTNLDTVNTCPTDTNPDTVNTCPTDTNPDTVNTCPTDTNLDTVNTCPTDTNPDTVNTCPTDTNPDTVNTCPTDTNPDTVNTCPTDTNPDTVNTCPTDTNPDTVNTCPTETNPDTVNTCPTDTSPDTVNTCPTDTNPDTVNTYPTDTNPDTVNTCPTDTNPDTVNTCPTNTNPDTVNTCPTDTSPDTVNTYRKNSDAVNKCLGKRNSDTVNMNTCLGKIPVFTVAHARQVLEVTILPHNAETVGSNPNPLLTIEHYYDLLLRIQDEAESELRDTLVAEFASKLLLVQDLPQLMNIGKGQRLYFHLYHLLSDHFPFWSCIVKSLPQFFTLNKSTRPLNAFLSLFKAWLMSNTDLSRVLIIAASLEPSLSFLIADKFGMSVLSLLVICSSNVKVILNSNQEDRRGWADFLVKLIRAIDHHPHVENPLVGSRKHLVQFLNAIAPSNVHLKCY
ncbi:hypothetical protein M8J76_015946 [Diaphorina citri]|nr:hypothetical protein M8J75_011728 [Diaphorina citri]KAI5750481.1 hypothetical protein M8J76_015946 [Diaphorina citri]